MVLGSRVPQINQATIAITAKRPCPTYPIGISKYVTKSLPLDALSLAVPIIGYVTCKQIFQKVQRAHKVHMDLGSGNGIQKGQETNLKQF